MKFSIPYNGDRRVLDVIISSRLKEQIHDIYFAGNPLIIPSGRRPKIKCFIKNNGRRFHFDDIAFDKDIERLISESNKHRIKCNLLLNFEGALTNKQIKYVNKLIEMGVSITTVGNLKLLFQLRRQLNGKIKIQNSVYIEIGSINTIAELLNQGINIVLLPPDRNHDLDYISRTKMRFKEKGVEFKLLVNEGCLTNCKHRKADQISAQNYSITSAINDYIENPNEIRPLNNPCRIQMNKFGILDTNFIHPSDIYKYQKYNLIFKIAGRSFDSNKIIRTLKAYSEQTYSGDLRDIVENFKHSTKPIFNRINSKTSFMLSVIRGYGK